MITGFEHQVQLSLLIKAVGMGYFSGILLCAIKFISSLFGKSTAIICVRDILFFVLSAFLCFLFSLKYNSGIIRFYVLAGELTGFLIFNIFPGKQISAILQRLSERISGLTKKLFKCTKKSQKN
jgi:spore cortex biosynthesis protein YabQ